MEYAELGGQFGIEEVAAGAILTGTVNLDQLLHDRTVLSTSHDPASDAEVTVKP